MINLFETVSDTQTTKESSNWSMGPRRRLVVLALIMVAACIFAIVSVSTILYRHKLTEHRDMLQATARSQARLIEAVARNDREIGSRLLADDPSYDAYTVTLSQILYANDRYEGIGVTGEFTLARRDGENITFVMRLRHDSVEQPEPVAFDSELAEPMRRALRGQSGTIVGLDYRGVMVMAAHEPVRVMNLGIVAKIDMDEIRAPFIKASLIGTALALLFVLFCVWLFSRISYPFIEQLEQDKKNLEKENKERRIAESELRSAYEMLVNAEESADMGSWVWNKKTGDLKWSDGLCHLHGLEPGGFNGRSEAAIRYIHQEDRSRIEEQFLKMVSSKQAQPLEYRIVTIDGEVKTVRGTSRLLFDEKGEVEEVFGTIRDLSASKRTDLVLRRIFSEAPFMAYVKDREGCLVFVNRIFAENFDSTVEEINGRQESDLISGGVNFGQAHADDIAVIDSGQTLIGPEESYTWTDGSVNWYQTVKVPFLNPVSDEWVLFCMSVDLTEQNHLKEQLREHGDSLEEMVKARTAQLDLRIAESENLNRAMLNLMDDLQVSKSNLENTFNELEEKNQELDAFSYSVSHDLRAPLRAMEGFSEILMMDYSDSLDEKGADYLQRISTESQRMSHLINYLLDLGRLGRVELDRRPVDITVIAREVLERYKERDPERQVETTIADGLVAIGDLSLLRQTLDNLIGNAWKFTCGRSEGEIEIGSTEEDGAVVFFVKDNGVGFEMKYSDKLFTPFQRLHSKTLFSGSGIGLSTVHRIVKRHHGRIWFESKVDEGATFFFTLPD